MMFIGCNYKTGTYENNAAYRIIGHDMNTGKEHSFECSGFSVHSVIGRMLEDCIMPDEVTKVHNSYKQYTLEQIRKALRGV